MSLLRYFNANTRRRAAPAILVLGAWIVWGTASDKLPHEQDVRLVLPHSERSAIRSVQVVYRLEEDDVAGFSRAFPDGAPPEVQHTPSLAPGRYGLSVAIIDLHGSVHRSFHRLDVPTDGVARIPLVGTK